MPEQQNYCQHWIPSVPLVYDLNTQKIFVRSDVDPNLLSRGGLEHELAHARLAGFCDPQTFLTSVPVQYRDAISESYEDVAADILAYQSCQDKTQYVRILKDRYSIHSMEDARSFIEESLVSNKIINDGRVRRYEDASGRKIEQIKELAEKIEASSDM
ncbi:MAG: hypothetical protein ABH879_07380 [archaeon]